jgi:hypothetical protein
MGVSAVADSASPQTLGGAVADTQSGGPKVGCKCLAMQRKAEEAKIAERDDRLNASRVAVAASAEQEQRTTAPEKTTKVASCCEAADSCCEVTDRAMGASGLAAETISEDSESLPSAIPAEVVDEALRTLEAQASEDAEQNEIQATSLFGRQQLTLASILAVGALTLHSQPRTWRRSRQANFEDSSVSDVN